MSCKPIQSQGLSAASTRIVLDALIVFGVELEVLRLFFGEVEQAATITCLQAVTYEQNVPVYVCRKPIIYLKDAWPRLRAHAFLNG